MNTSHYTDGLRELADWLDAHPEWLPGGGANFYSYVHGASADEDMKAVMARVARDMGTATKRIDENSFSLDKQFGPHTFTAFTNRAKVCERVVVGTHIEKTVEKVPVGEVVYEEREIEVEVEEVEWVCPPSLLGAAG